MLLLVFLLVFVIVSGEDAPKTATDEEISKNSRISRDSYIDAYTESHGGNVELNKVDTDREMSFPTGFQGGFPDEHFGVQYPYPDAPSPPHYQHGPPHHQYGPPHHQYGPPHHQYGPPHHQYGPPHHQHGPPQPMYGPPHPPAYGPSPFQPHTYGPPAPPIYGVPYGILGIFDKLKLKLDLITVFKILLKIVLFKKLVSFIAIICLLLFIPWLKAKKAIHHQAGGGGGDAEHDEEDDDLMMRKITGRSPRGDDRLNNITVYVLEAIENFTKRDSRTSVYDCDTIYCTVNRIAKNISSRMSHKE